MSVLFWPNFDRDWKGVPVDLALIPVPRFLFFNARRLAKNDSEQQGYPFITIHDNFLPIYLFFRQSRAISSFVANTYHGKHFQMIGDME